MKSLERRILVMEAALAHLSQAPVILEAGEGPEFEGRLSRAKASGARVIVAHKGRQHDWLKVLDGVEHHDELSAGFLSAALMPSLEGRANRLADILHSAQGHVIVPESQRHGRAGTSRKSPR